jgi:hypothetical protein
MNRGFGVMRIDDPRIVGFDNYPGSAGGYYFARGGVYSDTIPTTNAYLPSGGSSGSGGGGAVVVVPVEASNPLPPSPAASFPLQRTTDAPAPQEVSNEGLPTPLLIALVVAAVIFLK